MVHTATLTYSPSNALFKEFIALNTSLYDRKKKIHINSSLKHYGIVIIAYSINRIHYRNRYMFSMRINFKRLIEQKNRVEICTEQDRNMVAEEFNNLLKGLNLKEKMPKFFAWKVNRIDYCINVKTPYVKEYVDLLQKGDKPYYVRLKANEQRNYTQRPGSLYLVGKSITINFYDKQDQLRNRKKEDASITDEVIAQAKDILRLEVQCHKPRTEYLKVKYGMTAKNIHHYLNNHISYDVLETILLNVVKKRDYLRRKKALGIIEQSNTSHKVKERLIQLINDINTQHQSVWKVREKYLKDNVMSKDTFSRYLRKLDELNINPVTISDNKRIESKSLNEGLTNLYDLFYTAFQEQIDIDIDMLEDDTLEDIS